MWWTAATNLGVEYALKCKADFIITLNNDLVVSPDYIQQLVTSAIKYPKSLIGSINVDSKNIERVVFAGIKWNSYTAKYRNVINLNKSYTSIKHTYLNIKSDLLPGRGVLVPAQAFIDVGLYDAYHFPHYAADEDFSRRCFNKGYKLYVNTHAPVFSEVDATGLHKDYKTKSIKRFIENFSSMRSPNRLTVRWHWAVKHGKIPAMYFFFDLARITLNHYLKSTR
jgi:GT2 family glycosyltransferase